MSSDTKIHSRSEALQDAAHQRWLPVLEQLLADSSEALSAIQEPSEQLPETTSYICAFFSGSNWSADFWPSLLKLSSGELICAFNTSDQGNVDQLNIKMVRSADNGYTWAGEQMISTAAHSESWPALAQRPDGSVICVWDSDAGLGSDVYYLYSSRLVIP